ncbi:MAG: hypothetical protein ACK56I_14615, partial [bacterium]
VGAGAAAASLGSWHQPVHNSLEAVRQLAVAAAAQPFLVAVVVEDRGQHLRQAGFGELGDRLQAGLQTFSPGDHLQDLLLALQQLLGGERPGRSGAGARIGGGYGLGHGEGPGSESAPFTMPLALRFRCRPGC